MEKLELNLILLGIVTIKEFSSLISHHDFKIKLIWESSLTNFGV